MILLGLKYLDLVFLVASIHVLLHEYHVISLSENSSSSF